MSWLSKAVGTVGNIGQSFLGAGSGLLGTIQRGIGGGQIPGTKNPYAPPSYDEMAMLLNPVGKMNTGYTPNMTPGYGSVYQPFSIGFGGAGGNASQAMGVPASNGGPAMGAPARNGGSSPSTPGGGVGYQFQNFTPGAGYRTRGYAPGAGYQTKDFNPADFGTATQSAFDQYTKALQAPSSVDQVRSQMNNQQLDLLKNAINIDANQRSGQLSSDMAKRGLEGPGVSSDIASIGQAQIASDANKNVANATLGYSLQDLQRQADREAALRSAYGQQYQGVTSAFDQGQNLLAQNLSQKNQIGASNYEQNQNLRAQNLAQANTIGAENYGQNQSLLAQSLGQANTLGAQNIAQQNQLMATSGEDALNRGLQGQQFMTGLQNQNQQDYLRNLMGLYQGGQTAQQAGYQPSWLDVLMRSGAKSAGSDAGSGLTAMAFA